MKMLNPPRQYIILSKSKRWFFKWLKRYRYDGENWSKDLSRKSHHRREKIEKTMEQAIIATRIKLEKQLYAQIGVLNIRWHLEKQGLGPPPISTINKVLKLNNLVRKRPKYQPKCTAYPALKVTQSNFLHEFDVVGPRYLKTDGRFYSANIIDVYDRECCINPVRRQTKKDILGLSNSLLAGLRNTQLSANG